MNPNELIDLVPSTTNVHLLKDWHNKLELDEIIGSTLYIAAYHAAIISKWNGGSNFDGLRNLTIVDIACGGGNGQSFDRSLPFFALIASRYGATVYGLDFLDFKTSVYTHKQFNLLSNNPLNLTNIFGIETCDVVNCNGLTEPDPSPTLLALMELTPILDLDTLKEIVIAAAKRIVLSNGLILYGARKVNY